MAPLVRLFSRPRLPSLVVFVCAVSVSLNLFFVYSTRNHGHNISGIGNDDSSNFYFDQRNGKEVGDVRMANPSDVRGSSEIEFYHVEQAVLPYKERQLPDEERRMPYQDHPLPNRGHPLPDQVRQMPDQVRQMPEQKRKRLDQERRLPEQERRLPYQENPIPVSMMVQLEQADLLDQAKTFEKPKRLNRFKTLDKSKALDTSKTKDKSKPRNKISALPPCPTNPAGLEGELKALTTDIEPDEILSIFASLKNGGRLRPSDCLARERVAIIFPYRNRWPHLHITMFNLIPFLLRQKVDATFFVIEQAPTSTFNRGALLNIGFLEAEKIAPFDCYIFHDVDLIPLNDHNMYRCGDQPRHFASAMNKNGFRLMYGTFFGGVVGFSKKQYRLINGNSNIYFGWGGEDDDLWQRVYNKNMTVARYDNVTSRYLMIKHTRDKGNEKNPERRRILRTALRRQDVEGLSTTVYDVLSIEVKPLYTWIKVSLDLMTLLNTAPSYTRHDMWKFVKMWRLQQKELEKKRLEVDEDDKET